MNRLRVATIPDRHPYLAAVLPTSVRHLTFSAPEAPEWAPSPLLQRDFLVGVLAQIDVVHVHFGYESLSLSAIHEWIAAVRTSGTVLVVTVHDLRNPHQLDPADHAAHLGALVGAADEVLTLTAGAAAEIEERWHRTATVVAHPSLSYANTVGPAPAAGAPVVGIHLKSLRINVIEPQRIVRAAVAGLLGTPAVVQVNVHPDALSKPGLAEIRAGAERGEIELRVHERHDDEELADYLRSLHVSVLPYRFGTHSGWLELCRDLGTAVIAPDCGYYAEQWSNTLTYAHNEITGLDENSLAGAVRRAVGRPRPAPVDPGRRRRERETIRSRHEALYRRLVASSPARA